MKNTPQGVFQAGNLIVGPFGVLKSFAKRSFPPTKTAPLWHCSDPSCQSLHTVRLSSGKNKVAEAVDIILDRSNSAGGPRSEWDQYYLHISRERSWYDDMYLWQFPFLLANAFSEVEAQNILKSLIQRNSKEIRQRFPEHSKFRSLFSSSPEKISKVLSKPECFQLILLMSDEVIVETIESLIYEKTISIPSTEKRISKLSYGSRGWLDIRCECSQFGIRSYSQIMNIALPRLKILIKELYQEETEMEVLRWKLRHMGGETIYEKLDNYVHKEDPERIIKEIVFDKPDHIRATFKMLRYGSFLFPSSPEEESFLIKKILWKLGFEIGLYPPYQRLFWERMDNFLSASRVSSDYTEAAKESLRSMAVNFFVSLEELLDYSLSFITWTLLSDHYGVTKFNCNFVNARRFMASTLTGYKIGPKENITFDPNGKNTLYPLIKGFFILAVFCNKICKTKSAKFRRAKKDIPGYYGKTKIEYFPYLHRILLLDFRKDDLISITDSLKKITNELDKSQICNIRNRIEHMRQDFPKRQEIEDSCNTVKQIVIKMEKLGICPSVYLYMGENEDKYGRGDIVFQNYLGREIRIPQPSQCIQCRLPSPIVPQIVVPSIHVGDTNEIVRFKFEETSNYVKMWENYPKRKPRVPTKEDEQVK